VKKHDVVVAELERIANKHKGHLRPRDVVEAAKSPKSPLHSSFDWSDTLAARKWRLHQARNLIRVLVTYVGDGEDKLPMRVFVSLTPDRRGDRGYLSSVTVLSDRDLRRQLLSDALEEMRSFQEKYAGLKELAEIFKAMQQVRSKHAA